MSKKLTKENLKVLAFIKAHPGSTLAVIGRRTRLNAQHHVGTLKAARKVKRDRSGRLVAR